MAETLNSFFDRVTNGASPEFRSEPWYNEYGDCIHYHWREDEFSREWIDDKLTVYRSVGTGEAVGCEIKGVAALLRKLGDFGISIDCHDGTPLALFLFMSQQISDRSDARIAEKYRYLIEQAAKKKVEISKEVLAANAA